MKILFLAHFYPPEMGGAVARLHGLTRWLAAYGHEVTVVTGFPNYPSGEIAAGYRGKWRQSEEMDGVQVERCWVYASAKRSSMRRLANYFSFMASAFVRSLFLKGDYDVVVASSPPLFLGVTGWLLGRVRRVPFVFDIRDIWPDVAVEAGEFAEDALVTRMGNWLARFLYRRADHIVPVTQNKRLKIEQTGISAEAMTVVTNGVDMDLVPDLNTVQDRRAELGLEGKFVVLYAGLIGIAQGVGIALHAAEQLRQNPDIHFLIVGDGPQKAALEAKVAELGLTNVTMLPRQPREAIPTFMATADVCLVPLVSSKLVDAVPSKLLEAWSYQRPVILAAGGEAAEIVRSSRGGLVVAPEEPDQLTEAVQTLYDDPQRVAQSAQNGYQLVTRQFDRPVLAQQFADVLQRVAGLDEELVATELPTT